MPKDKKSTLDIILSCLKKNNITYCLGDESLIAILDNNLFKYGKELSLYIFNFSLIEKMHLKIHFFFLAVACCSKSCSTFCHKFRIFSQLKRHTACSFGHFFGCNGRSSSWVVERGVMGGDKGCSGPLANIFV